MYRTLKAWGASLLFSVLTLCGILYGSGLCLANQPTPWQIGFQPAGSPVMERIVSLHNGLLYVMAFITIVVVGLIFFILFRFSAKRNPKASTTTHHTGLEIIWTAIPTVIIIALAIPSIKLLNFMDQEPKDAMTLKIVGHQWYWSYEYPDHDIQFDSYMVEDKDLKPGDLRLLSVDNRVVVPAGKPIRLQLTATDVLHSWAVPSLGIKKDTVPGRLNQTWIQVDKPGLYYGQCSELCGIRHGFMPIVIEALPEEAFQQWLKQAKVKFTFLYPSPFRFQWANSMSLKNS